MSEVGEMSNCSPNTDEISSSSSNSGSEREDKVPDICSLRSFDFEPELTKEEQEIYQDFNQDYMIKIFLTSEDEIKEKNSCWKQ